MRPSPFVIQWTDALRGGLGRDPRALDLAMGRGRHTVWLARRGFRTFGIDRHFEAVRAGLAYAQDQHTRIHAWCADLTHCPLPRDAFDLIVVTRYLQRDLFASIRDALTPGGVVIYETFTVGQLRLGRHPRSPEHLLQHGELVTLFSGFELLFSEEVEEPDAVARVVARRPR